MLLHSPNPDNKTLYSIQFLSHTPAALRWWKIFAPSHAWFRGTLKYPQSVYRISQKIIYLGFFARLFWNIFEGTRSFCSQILRFPWGFKGLPLPVLGLLIGTGDHCQGFPIIHSLFLCDLHPEYNWFSLIIYYFDSSTGFKEFIVYTIN